MLISAIDYLILTMAAVCGSALRAPGHVLTCPNYSFYNTFLNITPVTLHFNQTPPYFVARWLGGQGNETLPELTASAGGPPNSSALAGTLPGYTKLYNVTGGSPLGLETNLCVCFTIMEKVQAIS